MDSELEERLPFKDGPVAEPGSPARRQGLVGVGSMVLLLVVACTGSGTENTSTSSSLSTTTAQSVTSTSLPESTSTTAPPSDPAADVARVWGAWWDAWVEVRADPTLDPTPLEQFGEPAVVASAIALLEQQRQMGGGPVTTDLVSHPKVEVTASGQASVSDCVVISPSYTDSAGVWYEGQVRHDGSSWTITSMEIQSITGCVPAGMADASIAAYRAYYDAIPEFWEPPNPDHPLLAELLVDPRLSNIQSLLRDHREQGYVFRSNPVTHPEVIEVEGPHRLVILDCYQWDPGDGLFHAATEERVAGNPAPREGQRGIRSIVMEFVDGRWKASSQQAQPDFQCEYAPTERGLPSV